MADLIWTDPSRANAFQQWLSARVSEHGLDPSSVRAASADASFRRYFRVDGAEGRTFIVMDAPPSHEDCRPFVNVARLLAEGGVNVPEVLSWDEAQGFMLLSDLGGQTYLAQLQTLDLTASAPLRQADAMYREAMDALIGLQKVDASSLAPYDRALIQRELDLFPEWYVARHKRVTLDDRQQAQLAKTFEMIQSVCEAQPQVFVHRDFHSRNLMVGLASESGAGRGPGVLDFQDAVRGPVTYDLVSLLRDAYIEWDESIQIDWAARYWERARKAGIPIQDDFGAFWRDFEWMGLQRHLKVLGIFARLHHRDGKDGYLKDLPMVWRYAHHVAMRYSVLTPLARLLEQLENVQAEDGYTF